jgi:hypothetical protein
VSAWYLLAIDRMFSVTTQGAMLAGVLYAIHSFVPPTAHAQTAATNTATTPGEVRDEVVTPGEALAWSLGSGTAAAWLCL